MSATLNPAPSTSQQIAKKSKSNLAFALACLPAQRRRDMISFYAFCRIVDDIADDIGPTPEAKKAELAKWRQAVLQAPIGEDSNHQPSPDSVLTEVLQLPARYNFSPELLAEIIDGVSSDQDKTRYQTIDELLAYCYKVASVVGLVSIRIFGHSNPQCREYAIALGYALQLTNIMRDVGQDAHESGRIYLPLDEMAVHGVTEAQIFAGQDSPGYTALMEQNYARARGYYEQAASLLPPEDKRSMIASEMMAQIYREILEKLRRNHYPSLHRRERLHPLRKASILVSYMVRGMLSMGRA